MCRSVGVQPATEHSKPSIDPPLTASVNVSDSPAGCVKEQWPFSREFLLLVIFTAVSWPQPRLTQRQQLFDRPAVGLL